MKKKILSFLIAAAMAISAVSSVSYALVVDAGTESEWIGSETVVVSPELPHTTPTPPTPPAGGFEILDTVYGLANGNVAVNIVRVDDNTVGFTVARGYTTFQNLWLAFDLTWTDGIGKIDATSYGNQGGVYFDGSLRWNFPEIGIATDTMLLTLAVPGNGTLTLTANKDAALTQTPFNSLDVKIGNGPAVIYSGRDWSFNPATGLMTITSEAGMKYWDMEKGHNFTRNDIKSVVFAEGVRDIDSDAFVRCVNLVSVTIPEGLEYIRESAFAATGLTEVTLPASLIGLFQEAFAFCEELHTVSFLGETPPRTGLNIFTGCGTKFSSIVPRLYVPAGSRAAYAAVFTDNPVYEPEIGPVRCDRTCCGSPLTAICEVGGFGCCGNCPVNPISSHNDVCGENGYVCGNCDKCAPTGLICGLTPGYICGNCDKCTKVDPPLVCGENGYTCGDCENCYVVMPACTGDAATCPIPHCNLCFGVTLPPCEWCGAFTCGNVCENRECGKGGYECGECVGCNPAKPPVCGETPGYICGDCDNCKLVQPICGENGFICRNCDKCTIVAPPLVCGENGYTCGNCIVCNPARPPVCGENHYLCGTCDTCIPPVPSIDGILTPPILDAIREANALVKIGLPCGMVITIDPRGMTEAARAIDLNINIKFSGDKKAGIPERSIMIDPAAQGPFGFEYSFNISEEQLTEAGLTAETTRLYYVNDAGKITQDYGVVTVNADGSITVTIDRASSYVLTQIKAGDVLGTGTPSMGDALQILRSVVGLSNSIDGNAIALAASNITEHDGDKPKMADALAILRFIVNLNGPLDKHYK